MREELCAALSQENHANCMLISSDNKVFKCHLGVISPMLPSNFVSHLEDIYRNGETLSISVDGVDGNRT